MSRYAVVLCAGRGERLWPLTSTRPKPLLPLPGGTLLSRLLAQLKGLVDGVVVVVGHLGWMVERYLDEVLGSPGWVRLAVQEEPRGTADAIRAGLSALPRSVDEVLVVYGDVYFSPSPLKAVVEEGANTVVAVKHPEPWRFGVLEVSEGRMLRVVEKPPRGMEPSNLVNAGVYLLERSLLEEALDSVKTSPRGELEATDALNTIATKTSVKVLIHEGYWRDVGRPWDLLDVARRELEEKLRGLREPVVEGEVEPGARLVGPVYVSKTAVVRSYTVIEGPAWIEGEVGPLARVRPYTITLPASRIGCFSEVKASILMEDARAPHHNYVGDSIIGESVNLGAGTITANLRFDHKTIRMKIRGELVDTGHRKLGAFMGGYSQTGINVSLMPGVRVGAFSWIAPGLTVYQDVPDCTFLHLGREGRLRHERLEGRIACQPAQPPWKLAKHTS